MRAWFAFIAIFAVSPTLADVVRLNDGRTLEGLIRRDGSGWMFVDASGKATYISDEQIVSIQKTGNLTPAQGAASRLKAMRFEAEKLSDASVAVRQFKRFIADNKDTPSAIEAAADLQVWEDRLARKLIKAGSSWVTPDEYAVLTGRSLVLAQQAIEKLKEGRMRDAETSVADILAVDANSISGLYLRGVIQFKQDKLADARKTFERLLELAPDHAPTLNNIAVISWQQKMPERAIRFYTQALLVSAKNRQVLDNIAEALHSLPSESSDTPAAKKLTRLFQEQDAAAQKEMEAQGLHRWGASWYDDEQMARMKADQKTIATKVKDLEKDFDQLRTQVRQIEGLIAINLQQMELLDRGRWRIDAITGAMIQFPLPAPYWQAARETETLRANREALLRQLATWEDRVRAIEQETPFPAYTGKQRIIETEGTPLALPQAPATRPAEP